MLSNAQLLDELMGRDRNLAPDEKRQNVRWDDESVCKYFLCGFCPAELFTNTRSDLGPCEKIHDDNLRKYYEKSSRFMKVGYEKDFLRYLQNLMADVERRIRRGHARLALSQNTTTGTATGGPVSKNEEKGQVLTEKIEELLEQIEELGSEGKVEEAQGMMKLVEQLKDEREQLRSASSTIESFAAQEKQMEVCEVCGAFLIVGDAQSRVDDHLMGKQHMGYAKIKATVEELKEKVRKKTEEPERDDKLKREREERELEREREREEREKKRRREEEEKEREREARRRRSHSRSRHSHSSRTSDRRRSRSRERRRSRSKEREKKRSRGEDCRSRDRSERSRDRLERKHRSRSRDQRRSRSRDVRSHKHRSRSREKERRSKDKERRDSDEMMKSSRKPSQTDRVSAEARADPMEVDTTKSEVNGRDEDLKSEGDTQSN
ncbi:luc7-like protein 3 isoform X1 [Cetorhinus maximus]|uniref:luc7-like protein 3 isoform X1 n=1 Tax=Carcharodon carcharias TaxID=13397 RepID=UPI001B7E8C61|nr:luc7-like protein 3 isoform X1 [Carcharodon carcharias]XP_041072885.1 luc7-like protein 3 isoform X1 [Carcharodon carcharias]